MPAQIFNVSIPRSGHHYLATLLHAALKGDMDYCWRADSSCCKTAPCTIRRTRFLLRKTHDSKLDLPRAEQVTYVIQHRDPETQVESYANHQRARLRQRNEMFPIDDLDWGLRWITSHAYYFVEFHRKWIREPPVNAVIVAYEELKSRPEKVVESILDAAGYEIARSEIEAVVAENQHLMPARLTGPGTRNRYVPHDPVRSRALPVGWAEEFKKLVESVLAHQEPRGTFAKAYHQHLSQRLSS